MLLFIVIASIIGISIFLALKTAVKSTTRRIAHIRHKVASFDERDLNRIGHIEEHSSEHWCADIEHELNRIDCMEGHSFEHWCADLLKWHRYSEIRVTKGSGDQGVDILAIKDGQKYAIQCKRYESKLSNKPIQEIIAGKSFYDCDCAVVMTNSYFTDGAVALADKTGVKLWDRDTIASMLSDYQNSEYSSAIDSAQHELFDEIELYSAATDDE
ncbi:MAG: restriction endonuclease [Oscillospiraceae bacterium]|nr:restriction endonuclease [Oscillospiraceae bacterium]MBR3557188.1 restriction endonuclease [Oscillospiraceae bacterium]